MEEGGSGFISDCVFLDPQGVQVGDAFGHSICFGLGPHTRAPARPAGEARRGEARRGEASVAMRACVSILFFASFLFIYFF